MIALDTNILARFLLKDDEKQYRTAVSLLQKKQEYTAPPSVLLELVWVLQVNDCTRDEIVKGLRALFGLPNFKPMCLKVWPMPYGGTKQAWISVMLYTWCYARKPMVS